MMDFVINGDELGNGLRLDSFGDCRYFLLHGDLGGSQYG